MNVKMVAMENVLTTVITLVEATSVLVDLATSFRERMRRGLKVGIPGESGSGNLVNTLTDAGRPCQGED